MIKFKNDVGNTLLNMRDFSIKAMGFDDYKPIVNNNVANILTKLESAGYRTYWIYNPKWDKKTKPIHVRYNPIKNEWINGGHGGRLFKMNSGVKK